LLGQVVESNKKGKIEYGVHISTFEGLEKRQEWSCLWQGNGTHHFEFWILINTKESSFRSSAGLGINEDGLQYAKLFSLIYGMIYQDDLYSYSEINGDPGNYLIKKR
jgi:hypothetical protein